MDYRALREIMRTLRKHEEVIEESMASIYMENTKIHENEQNAISQVATIMGTLV
jgi:hypothetical protein